MCLSVNNFHGGEAQEDMPCYKIVVRDEKNKWRTPIQYTPISEEILNGEKPFYSDDIFDRVIFVKANLEVEGGAIHTYALEIDALHDAKTGKLHIPVREVAVYRCVIPKGTTYIQGSYGGDKGYASKQIIFKKRIM